jgi:serine/threonine protein kinase
LSTTTVLLEDRDKLTLQFYSDNKFVAIKVLTGHMTNMYERALVWEPEALRLVSRLPASPHCTQLLDEFTIPGKGSAGSHMCFVMPVYGGDVKGLAEARTTALPSPLVKRILLHLLRGIAHVHGRGIVHTDIKPDNIFFSTTMIADDIEAWLTKEPSQRHALEASHDGPVQAAVSQPLPVISEGEAMRATYLLADFGCGMCSSSNFFDSNTHNKFQRNLRTSMPIERSHRSLYGHRRRTLERNGTNPRTFGPSVV